jgi:hypothetical protein
MNRWQTVTFMVVLGVGLAVTGFVEWVQHLEAKMLRPRMRE